MTRLKNIILSTVSILLALALLGVFASLGLAFIGVVLVIAAVVFVIASARRFLGTDAGTMTASDRTA